MVTINKVLTSFQKEYKSLIIKAIYDYNDEAYLIVSSNSAKERSLNAPLFTVNKKSGEIDFIPIDDDLIGISKIMRDTSKIVFQNDQRRANSMPNKTLAHKSDGLYLAHHQKVHGVWFCNGAPVSKKAYNDALKKATPEERAKIISANDRERLKRDLREHPKKLYAHKEDLPKEDIDKLMTEIEWDRKVKDVSDAQHARNMRKFKMLAEDVKTVADLTANAYRIYDTFNKFKNATSGNSEKKSDKPDKTKQAEGQIPPQPPAPVQTEEKKKSERAEKRAARREEKKKSKKKDS